MRLDTIEVATSQGCLSKVYPDAPARICPMCHYPATDTTIGRPASTHGYRAWSATQSLGQRSHRERHS